jgi:hypothetical protein
MNSPTYECHNADNSIVISFSDEIAAAQYARYNDLNMRKVTEVKVPTVEDLERTAREAILQGCFATLEVLTDLFLTIARNEGEFKDDKLVSGLLVVEQYLKLADVRTALTKFRALPVSERFTQALKDEYAAKLAEYATKE